MEAELATILGRAKALLTNGGWSQNAEARDQTGRPTHPGDQRARSWSLSGAIYRAVGFDGTPEKRRLYERAVAAVSQGLDAPLSRWNDTPMREVNEVLGALEPGYALASEDGSVVLPTAPP